MDFSCRLGSGSGLTLNENQIDPAAERHDVEMTQPLGLDAQTVDEGAVAAARVLHPTAIRAPHEPGVLARDTISTDRDLVVRTGADAHDRHVVRHDEVAPRDGPRSPD